MVFLLRELKNTTSYCVQGVTLSELQRNLDVQSKINEIEHIVYPTFDDNGMRNSRS